MLYGLAPALVHARASLTDTLKEPGGGSGSRRPRLRSALVAVQIAVTMILLVGAGLLMKSFVRVMSRDLRFDTERLLTFEVHIPIGDYLRRRGTVDGLPYFEISPPPSIALERIYHGLRAIPGAQAVAGASTPLLNSIVVPSATISLDAQRTRSVTPSAPSASFAIGVGASASHLDERRTMTAAYFLVTPEFFTSIRSSQLRGRDFTEHDTAAGEQPRAETVPRGKFPVPGRHRIELADLHEPCPSCLEFKKRPATDAAPRTGGSHRRRSRGLI